MQCRSPRIISIPRLKSLHKNFGSKVSGRRVFFRRGFSQQRCWHLSTAHQAFTDSFFIDAEELVWPRHNLCTILSDNPRSRIRSSLVLFAEFFPGTHAIQWEILLGKEFCFDFCLSGGKVGLAFAEEPGVGGGAAPVVNQHGHVNQDDDSHRQRPHPDVTVLTAEEALEAVPNSKTITLAAHRLCSRRLRNVTSVRTWHVYPRSQRYHNVPRSRLTSVKP